MKNIVFAICSLLFFIGGIWLYNKLENKIPDSSWLIVVIKILAALLALIIYIMIIKMFADIFNVTWSYPLM